MANPIKKLAKLSRREGIPLSASSSVTKVMQRRQYAPGVHGPKQVQKRLSTYGTQLREKQRAKLIYNLRERQFRNYCKDAVTKQGDTGKILLQMLELRLENVVFRLGLAKTRQQARQLVSHKFFTVNGKPVNIRSYHVKPGDEVSIKATKMNKKLMPELMKNAETTKVPGWLALDMTRGAGKVLAVPEGDDLQQPFDPKLIIEFYSR